MFGPSMPVPIVDEDTQEFWAACKEHRLVVQRCEDCGAFRFAPSPVCYECRSFRYEWVESAGVGEVYTWTVTYRCYHTAAEGAIPYNVVVVRLGDCGGAMVTSNLLGVDNDRIEPGMRVELVWEDVSSECALPRFRPCR
jgi:uncharacterized protein